MRDPPCDEASIRLRSAIQARACLLPRQPSICPNCIPRREVRQRTPSRRSGLWHSHGWWRVRRSRHAARERGNGHLHMPPNASDGLATGRWLTASHPQIPSLLEVRPPANFRCFGASVLGRRKTATGDKCH
nr:hypothetical protein CFP56_79281 [Quercus suber]